MSVSRSRDISFKCSKCGKTFPTRQALLEHTSSAHVSTRDTDKMSAERLGIPSFPSGETTHKCPVCEKEFDSIQLLTIHMENEHKLGT